MTLEGHTNVSIYIIYIIVDMIYNNYYIVSCQTKVTLHDAVVDSMVNVH